MERPSKIDRLLAGLISLERNEHDFECAFGGKVLHCRIDQLWSKKLAPLSQISLGQVISKFQERRLLEEDELGKKSPEIVFSGGGDYVLKLVTVNDLRKMEKILDDYVQHILANPQTLLAKTVKVFTLRTTDYDVNDGYLLMECVRPACKHMAFDIKGSLEGRSHAEEGLPIHSFGKDFDLLNSKYLAVLRENRASFQSLLKQLQDDINFLVGHNIMDYSLIISFSQERPLLNSTVELKDGGFCTFGLIDYLQEYNMTKRMEGALKGLFKNSAELSSVDTPAYSKRIMLFLQNKVFGEDPPTHQ